MTAAGHPTDPISPDERAAIRAAVQRLVAKAPPLRPEQVQRLQHLFRTTTGGDAA
jgi:hypothetical protein